MPGIRILNCPSSPVLDPPPAPLRDFAKKREELGVLPLLPFFVFMLDSHGCRRFLREQARVEGQKAHGSSSTENDDSRCG
jgi:hypothetical protein